MLARVNRHQKSILQKQVRSEVDAYEDVLDKMINDDWLDMDSRQQTLSRLKRKGNRALADQIARMDENPRVIAKDVTLELSKVKSASAVKKRTAAQKADDKIKTQLNKETKEAIQGKDNMISSRFLHEGSEMAHTVCRISTYPDREPKGTGFMISPRLMMTNQHVIASAEEAKGYILEFNFYANNDGKKIEVSEFFLKPEDLFVKSDQNDLDYAVIAVEKKNSAGYEIQNFGWNKLIEERGKAQIGEPLNIIHHPEGDPQKISIRQNYLIRLEEQSNRLDYMSDTMEGSSGAPVFNEEWEVVALHRASEVLDDQNVVVKFLQLIHNVDADLARQMTNKTVKVNLGIRISVIVNSLRLQMNTLNVQGQGLLQEVFDIPEWRRTSKVTENKATLTSPESTSYDDNLGTAKIADQINISGGSVQFIQYDKEYKGVSGYIRTETGGNGKVNPELYDNRTNSQKNVISALAFLQEAREKEYLPQPEEIENRKQAYYKTILEEIGQLSKTQLYDALHNQISTTLSLATSYPDILQLQNAFGPINLEGAGAAYDRARAHLYTWVDLHPDRVLRCVYTKAIIAPEQLLLKDLISKLGLRTDLPQRYRNNQFLNCEHIVPQSWFRKETKGVADLHHLITADGATNNFRSDGWYDDLDGQGQDGPNNLPEYITPGGARSDDNEHFEPKNNKALVARATLYFIVAHKGKLTVRNYDTDQIKTLIAWSNSEAPSDYELHRNESIFEIQGNRNPFIDFPEWVDKVDFLERM